MEHLTHQLVRPCWVQWTLIIITTAAQKSQRIEQHPLTIAYYTTSNCNLGIPLRSRPFSAMLNPEIASVPITGFQEYKKSLKYSTFFA